MDKYGHVCPTFAIPGDHRLRHALRIKSPPPLFFGARFSPISLTRLTLACTRPSPNPFTEGSLEHNQVNGSSGHMPPAPVFSVSVTGFATSKLSKKAIDSALHGGFSLCGHVVKVRLHLSTKPTKCSAVIEFNNPGAVEAACALSGSYIALGRLVVTRIRENGGGSSHVEGDFRPDGGGGNGGRASNKASKAQGQGRGGGRGPAKRQKGNGW